MRLKNEVTEQRILPIGYNAATTSARDKTILGYLSFGDESSSIDFWAASGPSKHHKMAYSDSSIMQKLLMGWEFENGAVRI